MHPLFYLSLAMVGGGMIIALWITDQQIKNLRKRKRDRKRTRSA